MSAGYDKVPLVEMLDFFNGKAIKPGGEGKYPAYGSNGIIGGSDEYRFSDGIIIGRVGAYCGSVQYCPGKFWASDNTIVAKPKNDEFDVRYLFFLLTVNLFLRIKETFHNLECKRSEALLKNQYEVQCFSNRYDIHLEKYFREARKRIDILTTNLSFLHDEYDDASRTFFNEICYALDVKGSQLKVRILTLDPESDFAAKRGRQLGYAPHIFRDKLRASLAKTRELIDKNYETARFELRTYDDFPNQIMYRADNDIFHCVVAQPTQSRRHLTFKLNRYQKGVDTSFTEHYQYIWSRAS